MLKTYFIRKIYKPSNTTAGAYFDHANSKKEMREKIHCDIIAHGKIPDDYDIKIEQVKF